AVSANVPRSKDRAGLDQRFWWRAASLRRMPGALVQQPQSFRIGGRPAEPGESFTPGLPPEPHGAVQPGEGEPGPRVFRVQRGPVVQDGALLLQARPPSE